MTLPVMWSILYSAAAIRSMSPQAFELHKGLTRGCISNCLKAGTGRRRSKRLQDLVVRDDKLWEGTSKSEPAKTRKIPIACEKADFVL
jgi:hypothetical protein